MAELSSSLLKNTYRRHSERSEESLCDQNAKKREIPHFADSVRNDEFGVFQQALRFGAACRDQLHCFCSLVAPRIRADISSPSSAVNCKLSTVNLFPTWLLT